MGKIKNLANILKSYLKPYQYMKDCGVNFSGGGCNPLYQPIQDLWKRSIYDYIGQ
jgi:hypothetical protein